MHCNNVHLKAHFKVPLKCTLKTHCNVHLQSEYKCALYKCALNECALNDFTNVHQLYIIMEVCDVLCKVHIQGTFKVV